MTITSVLKKILASWTDHPLAGYIRASDNTSKLDVAVSEIVSLDINSSALPDGAATEAKQDALLTELKLKADLTETQPIAPYADYFLEVQRGNYAGKSTVHKFGGSASVVATLIPVTITGTYNTPTAAVALEFISSSGNDSSGGSGARQITVQGIQSAATWVESTQTFSTNGVTPVAIGSWLRIYRWYVSQSGTYATALVGSHAGTLTIRVAGGGATWTQIPVTPFSVSQSQMAVYTIAKGKTGFFRSADVYVDSGKTLNVLAFQRPNADVVAAPFSAMRLINQWVGVKGEMHYSPRYPNGPFVGPCDFGFMAKGTAVAADITIDFELDLVNP